MQDNEACIFISAGSDSKSKSHDRTKRQSWLGKRKQLVQGKLDE